MADAVYGVRLKITPDNSGANPARAQVVLYRADVSTFGSSSEIARRFGTAVWYYDDTRPLSSGTKYYWVRTESPGYASSSTVGPVDAQPTDLSITA